MSKPELILKHVWSRGEGSSIESHYYPDPVEGEHESDRIHLMVTEHGGKTRGWLMNIEDAACIIECLSRAMTRAIEDRIPVGVMEEQSEKGSE